MSKPEIDLSHRIALVTGGSRGIGRACCVKLAEAGASVAVNYRSNRDAADETAKLIEAAGCRALTVQADVAKPDDVSRMVQETERDLGPIDLLVNNAGIFDYVSHEDTTPEIWQRTLDCNLTGAFQVSWETKSGMISREFGRIVNITSIAALRGRPMSIAYAVSKAGMTALTKGLAGALAEHNIRVNAVAPGLTDTDILEGVDQDKLDKLIAATPIPRLGRPEEIANTVVYLMSDLSSFTTGQTLVCDGGRVMIP